MIPIDINEIKIQYYRDMNKIQRDLTLDAESKLTKEIDLINEYVINLSHNLDHDDECMSEFMWYLESEGMRKMGQYVSVYSPQH